MKNIGLLSFINGLLVIPISTSVGYLSQHYTDITMLYWLLGLALLGLCFLFDVTDFGANPFEDGYNDDLVLAVHRWRYVIGIVLEFCGYQAAQSVILVSRLCQKCLFLCLLRLSLCWVLAHIIMSTKSFSLLFV